MPPLMYRMQQRYGTAAEWTAENPILLTGEIGWETDHPSRFKWGDGVTVWTGLPYFTSATTVFLPQAANTVFAGPTTGAAAPPTFRGLVLADLASALSTWPGSASIITVGTITTGVWEGTRIAAVNGGTGQQVYTTGDLLYASNSTHLSPLAAVASGKVLISTGVATAPVWGQVDLTSAVVGELPIANGGTNATSAATAFDNLSPITTLGDLIYGNIIGQSKRLGGNTAATLKFLGQTGTGAASAIPAWTVPDFADISGIATIAQGGTGQASAGAAFNALSPITTLGDLIYGNIIGQSLRLAGNTTATKKHLSQTGTGSASAVPVWDILDLGTIGGTVLIGQGGTGQNTKQNGFNALSPVTTLGDLIYGAIFGNNVRLAGNITATLKVLTQTGTGSVSAAPAWAVLDFTNLSGTASIAQGGTGQNSAGAAFNALSPITTLGDLIYGNVIGQSLRLAGNVTTTKLFLSQTGTGSASAVPVWADPLGGPLAFFGGTARTQRTNIGAITDSTTGTSTNTLGDTSVSHGGPAADATTTNSNFATLCDRINKLEQIMNTSNGYGLTT